MGLCADETPSQRSLCSESGNYFAASGFASGDTGSKRIS